MEVTKILEKYEGSNSFIVSVKAQFKGGRKLSQKQIDAVIRTYKRECEYLTLKAEKEKTLTTPPKGVQFIVGEILSFKEVEGYGYYSDSILKARIQSPLGFILFGSIPKAIRKEVEVGDKVSMMGTIKPKEKGFGYYSYPTNGKIITTQEWEEYLANIEPEAVKMVEEERRKEGSYDREK